MNLRQHPFAVNVRDLIGRPGEMREHEIEVPAPEGWGAGLITVTPKTPVEEFVRVESVHEGVLASVTASVDATGECGRCLRDIVQRVEVEFQELFAYREDETSEYEVRDDHVDLEPLLRDAVVLALPFQPVCRPDCPGLDPETGERLESAPEAERRESVDPRWAALQGFVADRGTDASGAENTGER